MSRPFHVTTNAAVNPSAGWNAAFKAALSFSASISVGNGSRGSMSPMGHSWVAGSGNRLLTATGLKFMALSPIGNVTQPWLPRYLAVRVTPLGRVTWTALLARKAHETREVPRRGQG